MTIPANLGTTVKLARQERGLRQDELAALAVGAGLDWTRQTVTAIETGRRDISVREGLFLADALRIDIRKLGSE